MRIRRGKLVDVMNITAPSLSRRSPAIIQLGLYARLNIGWLAPVLLLAVVASYNFMTLMSVPAPFVDEAWNANRAWGLLQTGRVFGTMDTGVFDNYNGYWTYFPYLAAIIHAGFIWLFGLSLFSVRLASLFFGLVLLIAIYVIGQKLYGRMGGFLAMLLVSISYSFIYSSHLGRHDIIASALGYSAIALYLSDTSRSFSVKSVLSGLAVSLTLDIHLNGIIFIPAIAVLFLLEYRWSVFHTGRAWGYVTGVFIGIGYFIAGHILPYPQTYFALFSLGNGSTRAAPIVDPGVFLQSALRTLVLINPLLDTLLVAGFVLLSIRRSASDKNLLVLATMLLGTFASVVQIKEVNYSIFISPVVSLVVSALLGWLLVRVKSYFLSGRLPLALAAGVIVSSLVVSPVPLFGNQSEEYQPVLNMIRQTITPGATVMGPQTYWFGLTDHNYLSWEQLDYYLQRIPGSTLADAFGSLRPDYFIVDRHLTSRTADEKVYTPGKVPFLYLPKNELQQFLDQNTDLVGEMQTSAFGDIRVYKINWAQSQGGAPAQLHYLPGL